MMRTVIPLLEKNIMNGKLGIGKKLKMKNTVQNLWQMIIYGNKKIDNNNNNNE